MRRVIELALTKGMARFVERANTIGLRLGPPGPTDAETFVAEREGSSTWKLFNSLPHGAWFFAVRPTVYRERAIAGVEQATTAIRGSAARVRGSMPRFVHETPLKRSVHVVEAETPQVPHESWALFLSGQFVLTRAILERMSAGAADTGRVLYIDDPVLILGAFLLLARNLAVSLDAYERVVLEVRLRGLKGRQLFAPPWRDSGLEECFADADTFAFAREIDRQTLVATWRNVALDGAKELYAHFHLDDSAAAIEEASKALLDS